MPWSVRRASATIASLAEWLAAIRSGPDGAPETGHQALDDLGLLDQPPRLGVQAPPRRRERDAARRALEQRHPRELLQRLKALGQRRLRDVEADRRAPDAAQIGGRAETAQFGHLRSP